MGHVPQLFIVAAVDPLAYGVMLKLNDEAGDGTALRHHIAKGEIMLKQRLDVGIASGFFQI